jgi:stage III sporulation protein AG
VEVIRRIKEWIANQDRKKLIENAAIVVIIGIIIIIAGSTIFSGNKTGAAVKEQRKSTDASEHANQTAAAVDTQEAKLKSVLSQIHGVGNVDVMITYESSAEEIPAYDIKRSESKTQEKDNEGGTRDITQEDYDSVLAYKDTAEGGKAPVILKETQPKVRGVLVVAEGAGSVVIRQQIISAVTVVLDVPVHKVEVAQRKK